MKISTSQQPVYSDMDKNLATIIDVLDSTTDSDWVLTPEGSLSGYCSNVCHESTEKQKSKIKNFCFQRYRITSKKLISSA